MTSNKKIDLAQKLPGFGPNIASWNFLVGGGGGGSTHSPAPYTYAKWFVALGI